MMLDSTSSPVDLSISTDSPPSGASHPPTNLNTGSGATSATSGGRRRTRSARGSHNHSHVHVNGNQQGAEAMDVEEDGRERKRVARR